MKRAFLAASTLLLALSCQSAPATPPRAHGGGAPVTSEVVVSTAWTHVGTWMGKPPLERFDFDVALRNPGARPLWIAIPERADAALGSETRGAKVYDLPGDGPLQLWRFEGAEGFFAVLLAPGASLTLRALGLEAWWSEPPSSFTLPLVLAEAIEVNGETAARWVGVEPVAATSGDHDARIDPMKTPLAGFRQGDATVRLVGASPLAASVALSRSVGSTASWPADWASLAGRTVTVEGKAVDEKVGAVLLGDGPRIYVEGLDAWPGGLYQGGDRGKRVRVTGVVRSRDDLPVFVPEPGEPARAGMPVPEGTDLAKARRRWVLGFARWVVLD